MARTYLTTIFGERARALQAADGSREGYARMEAGGGAPDALGERELAFVAARDSFVIASVTERGWPYVQHRGGPPGFLRPLGGNLLGFADYRGNRQHVTEANLAGDGRVSLLLIDYPARRRLKLLGHAAMVPHAADPALVEALMPEGYDAVPERACVIDVLGFDWNCPQHITPRFTAAELAAQIAPLAEELTRLRAENAALRATSPAGDHA